MKPKSDLEFIFKTYNKMFDRKNTPKYPVPNDIFIRWKNAKQAIQNGLKNLQKESYSAAQIIKDQTGQNIQIDFVFPECTIQICTGQLSNVAIKTEPVTTRLFSATFDQNKHLPISLKQAESIAITLGTIHETHIIKEWAKQENNK